MERIVTDLRTLRRRILDSSRQFYAEDAAFYIEKAIEAMEEGRKDPELWEKEQLEVAKAFQRLIPYAVRRMSQNSLKDLDPNQEDEDSTEPEDDSRL